MIYRFSVEASVCFDVLANSEAEAEQLARQYVANEQPECFVIRDVRRTRVYPGTVNDNLELIADLPEDEADSSYTVV